LPDRRGEQRSEKIMTNATRSLLALFAMRFAIGLQFQWVAASAAELRSALGLSFADIGTLIGVYSLPGIVMTVVGGLAAQRFGDRRILIGAFVLMAAGGAVNAIGDGFTMLLVGRFLAGLGGVAALTLLIKVTSDLFEGPRLRTALAIVMTSWPGGIAAGTVAWGALSAGFGWQAPAIGAWLVILLALGLSILAVPPPSGPLPRGGLLRPTRREWQITGIAAIVWAGFNGGLAVYVAFLPAVLAGAGHSASRAASLAGLAGVAMAVAMPIGGRILDLARRPAAMVVATLAAAIILAMAVAADASSGLLAIVGGAAIGLPTGALGGLLAGPIAPERKALAYGLFGSGSNIGIALGTPLAGLAQDLTGAGGAPMAVVAMLFMVSVVAYGGFIILLRRPLGPGEAAM
jgi:predicted MFS family arabinose efflux permease